MRHRAIRHATTTLQKVCQATIKVAATLFVLTICLMVTLKYFGLPVPSADQVLRDFARIF